jgi:glycosyltransferase involved in cell wall biosynthesis
MNDALISVIVPVYNHARYVKQALESVLQQDYRPLELIVIDDGSKDNSAAMAEELLSHPLPEGVTAQVIRQENCGAHHTINRGLALAKGTYLTILNSDDAYAPGRLSAMVAAMQAAKSDFAFSYVTHIDDSGQALAAEDPRRHWYAFQVGQERIFATSIGFHLFYSNMTVSTGNHVFTRALYETLGGYADFKLAHDLDFALRAVVYTEPVLVPEALYLYRVHSGNTFEQIKDIQHEEMLRIFLRYLQLVSPAPPPNKLAPCHWYWPYEFNVLQAHIPAVADAMRLMFAEVKAVEKAVPVAVPPQGEKPFTLISHELTLSGAPRLLTDIGYGLRARGYGPRMISMLGGALTGELSDNRLPWHSIFPAALPKFLRRPRLQRYLPYLFLLLKLPLLALRVRGPVLVNSSASLPLMLTIALIFPKKPITWYVHESVAPTSGFWFRKFPSLVRRILARPHVRLWFGSAGTQEVWQREGFMGEVRYWSGIPSLPMKAASGSPRNILTVGTVAARKGPQYLIRAFVKGVEEGRLPADMQLTILGFDQWMTDYFARDLAAFTLMHGLTDRIHLVPIQKPEVVDAMFDRADIYVQPSIMECLPLALMQAMTRGIPVITSGVDGCAEAIPDDAHGYTCLPRHVDSILDALEAIVRDPQEAANRAATAKRRFDTIFAREVTEAAILDALGG